MRGCACAAEFGILVESGVFGDCQVCATHIRGEAAGGRPRGPAIRSIRRPCVRDRGGSSVDQSESKQRERAAAVSDSSSDSYSRATSARELGGVLGSKPSVLS